MPIDLDALEAKAKAATPGPWGHYGHRPHINVPDEVRAEDGTVIVTVHNDCDAAFIAAANPAAILELIAELRQARAERDWLAKNLLLARAREFSRKRCPSREHWYQCDLEKDTDDCIACWIKAAHEAVEEKK